MIMVKNEEKNTPIKKKKVVKKETNEKQNTSLEEKNETKKVKKCFFKDWDITKDKFNTLELILIMIITVVIGILIGNTFKYKSSTKVITSNESELDRVYNTILSEYYDTVDKNKLLEAGIKGMLDYLGDDYSLYMNKDEADDFEERLDGVYYGIGAELIFENDNTSIYSVFDNSPAKDAGLKPGDIISKVNGNDAKGKIPAEIAAMIKGNDNLKVKLTVIRDGKEKEISMTTRSVNIPSINSSVIERNGKKIGYINIKIFAANTATQLKKHLKEIEAQNIDRLIIDVRDNAGGHLNVVSEIMQMFFKEKAPLYQIKSKDKVETFYDETKESRAYPVVIITNGASASGSEILASGFKEVYKSEVIGTKTFGKGTVQTVKDLKNGGIIKYTIQTWLSATGSAINKVGVMPTIEVELNNAYYTNPTDENDNQLQKAIEIISNK